MEAKSDHWHMFSEFVASCNSVRLARAAQALWLQQNEWCCQGRIKWTRGPGQSRDRKAPKTLSATAAFQMPSFQLSRSTGQNRQNWYILAAYTSETIGGDHAWRCVCGLICSNRKLWHKKTNLQTFVSSYGSRRFSAYDYGYHCGFFPLRSVFLVDLGDQV